MLCVYLWCIFLDWIISKKKKYESKSYSNFFFFTLIHLLKCVGQFSYANMRSTAQPVHIIPKLLQLFVVSRTSLVFQYNWILVFIHFCDWIKIDWISGFHVYVERILQCYCHMSWCLTYSKKSYGIVTISYCIKETKADWIFH